MTFMDTETFKKTFILESHYLAALASILPQHSCKNRPGDLTLFVLWNKIVGSLGAVVLW